MSRMNDSLQESKAQQELLKLINNKNLARLVGSTLAEIAVELGDKIMEARHWKTSFETVRAEIRALAGIILAQRGIGEKIVITEKELRAIPDNLELFISTPEPGVRIYELRPRSKLNDNPNAPEAQSILARPN